MWELQIQSLVPHGFLNTTEGYSQAMHTAQEAPEYCQSDQKERGAVEKMRTKGYNQE